VVDQTPNFLLTLTRSLLETLELQKTLYVMLTGVTCGDGLGFNRAFLFLSDEGRRKLEGVLAIGPLSEKDAHQVWERMKERRFGLDQGMQHYDRFMADAKASALTQRIVSVCLDLPFAIPAQSEHPGNDTATTSRFTSFIAAVWSSGEPLARNHQSVPLLDTGIVLRNFALVPLRLAATSIGLLVVDNPYNGQPIEKRDMDNLTSLANLCAVAVERARLHERIRAMAEQDGLTGLANRRQFDERYPRMLADAARTERPLALLLMDLDDFKGTNDRWGHLAGDTLLKEVAKIILGRIRQGDLAARYGGDEMVMVLEGSDGAAAAKVAGEICRSVTTVSVHPSCDRTASASFGVAQLPSLPCDPAHLLAAADHALYEAKRQGRNRVIVYDWASSETKPTAPAFPDSDMRSPSIEHEP